MTTIVSRRVGYAPRVIFLVALGAAGLGAVLWWPDVPACLMFIGYLVWLLVEAPVTFRRAVAVRDVRTLVPYGVARIVTVAAAALGGTAWGHARDGTAVQVVAAFLFVAGVALRELAIRTLGRFYSHHVALQPDHAIVTSGPYGLIRHPAYSGMLLAHVGLVLYFLNPVSATGLALLGAAVLWRIRVEEKVLWQLPHYRRYATGRARLIPGVW